MVPHLLNPSILRLGLLIWLGGGILIWLGHPYIIYLKDPCPISLHMTPPLILTTTITVPNTSPLLFLSSPCPLSLGILPLDLRERWVAHLFLVSNVGAKICWFHLLHLKLLGIVITTSYLLFFWISWGIKKDSWLLQESRKILDFFKNQERKIKRVQRLIPIQAWFKPIQALSSSELYQEELIQVSFVDIYIDRMLVLLIQDLLNSRYRD